MPDDIRERIQEAEMILVGLGEEFQCPAAVRKLPEYVKGKEAIQEAGILWLLPAWEDYCERRINADTGAVLGKLADLLTEKNYFVISVAMSDSVAMAPWRQGRLVMPCGTASKLQSKDGCGREPIPLSDADRCLLEEVLWGLYEGRFEPGKLEGLGSCDDDKVSMVLNNIYAESYDERGYLESWKLYTKWLQGTLNRKILILELGVGMHFPSVIRFPFEKAAFFNQKAQFYRINEKLYHMTEELKGKGHGISQNAIDCMRNL